MTIFLMREICQAATSQEVRCVINVLFEEIGLYWPKAYRSAHLAFAVCAAAPDADEVIGWPGR
jgi:hypothetical protein